MSNGTGEEPRNPAEPISGSLSDPIIVKDLGAQTQTEALEKIAKQLSQLTETNKLLEKINVAATSLDINQRIQSLQDAIIENNKLEWTEDRKKYEELKKQIEDSKKETLNSSEPLGAIQAAFKYIGKIIPANPADILKEGSKGPSLSEALTEWITKNKLEKIKAMYPEAAKEAEKDEEDAKKLRDLRKKELEQMEFLRSSLQPFVQEFLKKVEESKAKINKEPVPQTTQPASTTPKTETEIKAEPELYKIAEEKPTPAEVIEPERPVQPKKETTEPQTLKVELVKIDEKILEKLSEIFKKNLSQQEIISESGTTNILDTDLSSKARKAPRVPTPAINAATIAALKTVGLYTAAGTAALAAGAGVGYIVNNVANDIYEGVTGEKTESVIGEGVSNILGYKDTIKPVTPEEIEERRKQIKAEEEKAFKEAYPEKRIELDELERTEKRQYEEAAINAGQERYTFKGVTYPVSLPPVPAVMPSSNRKSPFIPSEVKAAPALNVPNLEQTNQTTKPTETTKNIEPQASVVVKIDTGSKVESISTSPVIRLKETPTGDKQSKPDPATQRSLDTLDGIYQEIKNLNQQNKDKVDGSTTLINGSGTSYAFSYNLNAGTGITSSRKETSNLINKYIGLF